MSLSNLDPQTTCLACGKPLVGRSDKKFCDSYCRNGYNNQHKKEEEKYIQHINRIIRRNRRILKTLCPQGKAIVRKDLLDKLGYRYGIFSGIYRNSDTTYYLCYDYGFAVSYEKTISKAVIIQQQDYMRDFDPWKMKANKQEPS